MKDNRLLNGKFLTLAPLVCSLLVIFIHQYNAVDMTGLTVTKYIEAFISHGIGPAAVPMFFCMSGYLFYLTAENLKDVFKKQRKRIKSVFVPFIAWSAFYYLAYNGYKYVTAGILQFDFTNIIRDILFFKNAFLLWYMFQLCIYVFLAPIIYYILKNKVASALCMVIFIILGVKGVCWVRLDFGEYSRVVFQCAFFAYYFFGCCLAKYADANSVKKFINKIPLSLAVAIFLVLGFTSGCIYDDIIEGLDSRTLVPLVFISFLILMLKICEFEKDIPKPPVSGMIIYGIHPFIGMVLARVWPLLRIEMPILLKYFINFIVVTAGSFLAGWAMKKLMPPIYKIFSGNR